MASKYTGYNVDQLIQMGNLQTATYNAVDGELVRELMSLGQTDPRASQAAGTFLRYPTQDNPNWTVGMPSMNLSGDRQYPTEMNRAQRGYVTPPGDYAVGDPRLNASNRTNEPWSPYDSQYMSDANSPGVHDVSKEQLDQMAASILGAPAGQGGSGLGTNNTAGMPTTFTPATNGAGGTGAGADVGGTTPPPTYGDSGFGAGGSAGFANSIVNQQATLSDPNYQPLNFNTGMYGYELGPDSWLGQTGIPRTGIAPGAMFDPTDPNGQGALLREYYQQQGQPYWMAQRDQPFIQSMQVLAPLGDPTLRSPTQAELANMVPGMAKDANTPGQYINAPFYYDQIMGGNPEFTQPQGMQTDPVTQVNMLNQGLGALAPYYGQQEMDMLMSNVAIYTDEWMRGVEKGSIDPVAVPLVAYLESKGADNWM